MVFVSKNRNLSKATPVIPQFPRFPGFQREAVRATLEKLQIFKGFTMFYLLINVPC